MLSVAVSERQAQRDKSAMEDRRSKRVYVSVTVDQFRRLREFAATCGRSMGDELYGRLEPSFRRDEEWERATSNRQGMQER